MKKIAFIPSRSKDSNFDLENYLRAADWDPQFLVDRNNIFDAYSEGVESANLEADDKIILCHDDIQILTDKPVFNSFIDQKLDQSDTGFIGIAGTRLLGNSAIWWEGLGQTDSAMNRLSGFAMHGTLEDNHTNFYGHFGQVAVLDGVFLCTTGKVLNTIQLTKPKSFSGDWDFYDVFYTAQAYKKGLKNYTVPIQILHQSFGETSGKESWHENRRAFSTMFEEELPMFVR